MSCTLDALRHQDCRYIIGEAERALFAGAGAYRLALYCGEPAVPGRSYCAAHAARCFVPGSAAPMRPPQERAVQRAAPQAEAIPDLCAVIR